MKWLWLIPLIAGGLVALMAFVGALLPRDHVAIRTASFRQAATTLYATARDFSALPSWRRAVQSAELLPAHAGRECYREVSGHGVVTYLVLDDTPGQRLVVQIADRELPFGGTWTFEFLPAADGTTVRITERGFVNNPLWRFLARFVFGYGASLEDYLRDLGRKFGENVTPRQ